MRIGIPRGLLYDRYHPFFEGFFSELGAELIISSKTNRSILDDGVKSCVDEACLPVKVFHGHVESIKDKCDMILIPRIMRVRKREFICPKFCGLPEMILNSIEGLPRVIGEPIYADTNDGLVHWANQAGGYITGDRGKIKKALNRALKEQKEYNNGIKDVGYNMNIALAGHPYNIYDSYVNMGVVKKLNNLGVGVITEENIDDKLIDNEVRELYKKPFWTFARNSYGFSTWSAKEKMVEGVVYISSFACGIDSVITELIKDSIGEFPMLILKIDEHTGEAGVDTRIEAFVDMLERRR